MFSKLLVLSLLGGVTAQFLPTPCPNSNDETAICTNNQVCTNVPTNAALNYCLSPGNDECVSYSLLGEDGDATSVSPGGIIPSDTCCDGNVCTWGQSCVNRLTGNFVYDGVTYDAVVLARNDWMLPSGSKIENRPRVCANSGVMTAGPGTKIIFIPLMSILFSAVTGGMAYKSPNFAMGIRIIPGLVMIVTSFFLAFSEMWLWALVAAAFGAASLAVPSQNILGFYLLFQVTFLWLYLGGSTWVFGSDPANLFQLFQSDSNSGLAIMQSIAGSCGAYYNGYFTYEAATRGWSVSSARFSWGYCSFEWLGFEIIMATTQFVAFSFVVLQTAFAWLSGGDKQGPLSNI